MGLKEAFKLLVLEEIQTQPDLLDQQGKSDVSRALSRLGTDVLAVAHSSENGEETRVFDIANLHIPPVNRILRDLGTWLVAARDDRGDYEALCRGALLLIYRDELSEARSKVELAKWNHDEWAFAHHIYGLLRGIEGNVQGARDELWFALEREHIPAARERIQRALALMS